MTDETNAERAPLSSAAMLEARIEALEVLTVEMWAERLAGVPPAELKLWCGVMRERCQDATCQPDVVAEDAADRALKNRARLHAIEPLLARISGVSAAFRSANAAADRLSHRASEFGRSSRGFAPD